MTFEAFICHASEDKDSFVRPLAEALSNAGVRIWYDEFSLKVGDSLRKTIDEALSRSKFGIVILSPSFFAKRWTERELNGLVQQELNNACTVLPIWHGISAEEVRRHSAPLADIISLSSSIGIDRIVQELLKVIRNSDSKEPAGEALASDVATAKQYASRTPDLRLEFASGGNSLEWPEQGVLITEEEFVSNRMAAIRKGHAKRNLERVAPFSTMPGESRQELVDYNKKFDKYFGEVEVYLRSAYKAEMRCYRMPRLQLELVNGGSGPASDIRVTLKLGNTLCFWNHGSYPPEPKPPRTPDPPMAWLARSVTGADREDEFAWPISPKSKAAIFQLADSEATAWFELASSVKGAPKALPVLRVDSTEGERINSVRIDCTISSAELLEPIFCQLNLVATNHADLSRWPEFESYLLSRYETKMERWRRVSPHLFDDDE